METTYFAARDGKDTASVLMNKSKSFYNTLQSNSYLEKLARMWRAYYGAYQGYGNDHQINFTGEQGEFSQLNVNHFRNLAQHMHNMITSNRLVLQARAVNSDYKSLAQTYLADGILDYYMREKGLEGSLKKACEMAIVLGAGFIKMEWNATAGDIYDIDENDIEIREGEIEFSNLSPFDVVFDGTKESWNHDWVLCRSFQNRYNLIAKYPELKDKIMAVDDKNQANTFRLSMLSNDETDDIPVYEFYHKKTEALPKGRYMLFVSSDAVLLDTAMPYRVLPVFRISAGDILGTPYGYSPMFDVFPIQEGINALYSSIMSNQNAFAVQHLWVPRGADVEYSALAEGMSIIEGNAKPEPLNLTQTPAEVFKFLDMLIQAAETISGVNSVARGNPEASLKSGTALALVQSMALQFISGLQNSYIKLAEDTGSSLIQILKDYANTPKVVALVGKNNRTLLKEFTGENLSSINRVIVDVGNPLARTIAGRAQMAEQMLQMNLIKDPSQYFQVINTGRLDVLFEGDVSQQLLVRQENEWLSDGKNPIVSPFDIHAFHITEHRAVLDDPEIRNNPELVKATHDHIQLHLDMLANTDPRILQLTGQQPMPPGIPPQQQEPPYPNDASINNSSLPEINNPQAGQVGLEGRVSTVPGAEGVPLPSMPNPPAPFEGLPQTPEELLQTKA